MDNTQNNQQPPRPPGKYRSSCDACQSSKVRCSQEKPSCRRCTVQDVECVYSLSRRMGRPRQKNKDAPAATERKETTGPSSTTPGRAETENNTSPCLSTSMAMTTGMTTANLTSTTREEDSIAAAIASANNNRSSNGSVSSITGSSLGNNSTSPLMLNSDTPGDMGNDFIGDMDLDGVLASDMLDFAAFRDLQVPPLGIDCNDGGMGMDMNMGFSQFSDAASLLGFGPGPLPMGGMDSMMGFGMGDMTPLDPATPLSMADSMSDTSGTGAKPRMSQPTSNPSVSNYVPPLPMRSDCSCYATVLRLVASSQAHQHSTTATTIDSILGLEDDTKHMLSDLLKCHNCMRDPCVQLLAIVSVSTTLKLLRHAANYKLKPPSQRRLTMQSGLPLTPGSSPQDCNLYVGKFRVTDEMRAGFVRQVLSARVRRLLAELEGVFSNLRSLPQDAMSGAAIMVADDTYNELQTITGWIELWN